MLITVLTKSNPEIVDLPCLSELCSHIVICVLYFLFPSCSLPTLYTRMIIPNKEKKSFTMCSWPTLH
jgi:hypothetical protein